LLPVQDKEVSSLGLYCIREEAVERRVGWRRGRKGELKETRKFFWLCNSRD
jgi:hypothetical protein